MRDGVFRSMLADESGQAPRLGSDKHSLGVVTDGPSRDVSDMDGTVHPTPGEGMSVSPSPSDLPAHRIPREFKSLYRDAIAKKPYRCWQYADARYEEGNVTEKLALQFDVRNPRHGLIGPSFAMTVGEYREAVRDTLHDWIVIPWDGGQ